MIFDQTLRFVPLMTREAPTTGPAATIAAFADHVRSHRRFTRMAAPSAAEVRHDAVSHGGSPSTTVGVRSSAITKRQNNATCQRIYGGDAGLIHIEDGQRKKIGAWLASQLEDRMRVDARLDGRRSAIEAVEQNLCPGCFMVALVNAATTLAVRNGQSLSELGRSLCGAFQQMIDSPDAFDMESIMVMLDP